MGDPQDREIMPDLTEIDMQNALDEVLPEWEDEFTDAWEAWNYWHDNSGRVATLLDEAGCKEYWERLSRESLRRSSLTDALVDIAVPALARRQVG